MNSNYWHVRRWILLNLSLEKLIRFRDFRRNGKSYNYDRCWLGKYPSKKIILSIILKTGHENWGSLINCSRRSHFFYLCMFGRAKLRKKSILADVILGLAFRQREKGDEEDPIFAFVTSSSALNQFSLSLILFSGPFTLWQFWFPSLQIRQLVPYCLFLGMYIGRIVTMLCS